MIENKTSNVRFIQLSNYIKPQIVETTGSNWVKYGVDNNYFQYLIDKYNGSPTNNALINGISAMIYGKGLSAKNASSKPMDYAQMVKLFKKDEVKRMVNDLKMLGNVAIQIIYNSSHDRIAEIYHLPVESIRSGKFNEEDEITEYWYSKDWTRPNKYKPISYPAFGTSREPIEIMYIKPYKSGYAYYAPPDYQGGLQYCELEEEIANYHINNIKNGFSPTTLINFNNGQADTDEQRDEIERKVYNKFSGTTGSRLLLSFNESKEAETTVETVEISNASEQYEFLSRESSSKVMLAHRVVSPLLFGIKENTGFGNNAEELNSASRLFDTLVVKPFQEILTDAFDTILAFNDVSLDLYFETIQPIEVTVENQKPA